MKESSRQLVQEDRHWLQNGWIPTIHGHNCIAEGPTGSVLLLVVVATIVMMVLTNERNIQQASMVLLWAVRHKDTSPIQDDFLLQYVFSYVGDFQYLFIGSVSLKKSYTSLFSLKMAHINASTLEHTKLCWDYIVVSIKDDDDANDEQRRQIVELCRTVW